MKVYMYAILKEYFDQELVLRVPVATIDELKTKLLAINEEAKDILDICRFAVKDNFIDNSYSLQPNDSVSILPPASGG
jgi:molybdopterin synthase sulfur carrier subunit